MQSFHCVPRTMLKKALKHVVPVRWAPELILYYAILLWESLRAIVIDLRSPQIALSFLDKMFHCSFTGAHLWKRSTFLLGLGKGISESLFGA